MEGSIDDIASLSLDVLSTSDNSTLGAQEIVIRKQMLKKRTSTPRMAEITPTLSLTLTQSPVIHTAPVRIRSFPAPQIEGLHTCRYTPIVSALYSDSKCCHCAPSIVASSMQQRLATYDTPNTPDFPYRLTQNSQLKPRGDEEHM